VLQHLGCHDPRADQARQVAAVALQVDDFAREPPRARRSIIACSSVVVSISLTTCASWPVVAGAGQKATRSR
jgi:hypothetical protein